MRTRKIISILVSLGLIVLAIAAYFSGEAASTTVNGRIVTIAVGIYGGWMLLTSIMSRRVVLICPSCQKKIKTGSMKCPYCHNSIKAK